MQLGQLVPNRRRAHWLDGLTAGVLLGLALTGPVLAATPPAPEARPLRASFQGEAASRDVRYLADWVADSGDNRRLPFVIIDKKQARVLVFDAVGRLQGAAPALLGLARGDESVPGIGDRKLSSIRPEERTTPAGRFVAALGQNLGEKDIVWIDYDAAISLHRVVTANAKEQRLQRLATPTPADNRISYGCVNVPAAFYDTVVKPAFQHSDGVVYILPEVRSIEAVFAAYDVDDNRRAPGPSANAAGQ